MLVIDQVFIRSGSIYSLQCIAGLSNITVDELAVNTATIQ